MSDWFGNGTAKPHDTPNVTKLPFISSVSNGKHLLFGLIIIAWGRIEPSLTNYLAMWNPTTPAKFPAAGCKP